MKQGHFWQIPESPRDMRRLWEIGEPLTASNRPAWLEAKDIDFYRTLPTIDPQTLDETARRIWETEQAELENVRLFVDLNDPSAVRLFIPQPTKQAYWSIGLFFGRSLFELRPVQELPILTAEQVTDRAASYVADPFMVRHDGKWFMFFEVWNWHINMGEIAVASSNDALRWNYEQAVLVEPFHLSYPHVFYEAGEWYMVPESHQAGGVRLYRAKQFPAEWEFLGELLTGPYFADTTLFKRAGLWWLMTDSNFDMNDTLRLYYSERLFGPWQEHPRSPIVQGDPVHARPAGKVVQSPYRLLRFAQNCMPEYGTDVRVMEITQLTTTDYAERPALDWPIIGPSGKGWNAGGMHHVDLHETKAGWLAVVDGWVEE